MVPPEPQFGPHSSRYTLGECWTEPPPLVMLQLSGSMQPFAPTLAARCAPRGSMMIFLWSGTLRASSALSALWRLMTWALGPVLALAALALATVAIRPPLRTVAR